jgi:hypothetical protein
LKQTLNETLKENSSFISMKIMYEQITHKQNQVRKSGVKVKMKNNKKNSRESEKR